MNVPGRGDSMTKACGGSIPGRAVGERGGQGRGRANRGWEGDKQGLANSHKGCGFNRKTGEATASVQE